MDHFEKLIHIARNCIWPLVTFSQLQQEVVSNRKQWRQEVKVFVRNDVVIWKDFTSNVGVDELKQFYI